MNEERTIAGDTIDHLLFRVFGQVDESLLDQTFELNPQLSEYGTVLPAGVTVKLPDTPASVVNPTIHLWD